MIAAMVTMLQILLGLMLVGAGAAKLTDLKGFASTLAGLGLGGRWARGGAKVVAGSELGIGLLSVTGIAARAVGVLVFALMLAFLVVSSSAARWRPQVRCRCFGGLSDSRFGSRSVILSLALVLASGLVVLLGHTESADYGLTNTLLLLVLAAAFATGCAAAANALEVMRREVAR